MAQYSMFFGHFDTEEPLAAAPAPPRFTRVQQDEDSATSRLTLRIPVALKRRVEASAQLDGMPADVWAARALARSVDPRLGT